MRAQVSIDTGRGAGAFDHGDASVPALDAVATADGERKKLVLALVNRHATGELVCNVSVNGEPLTGSVPAEVLRGDSADAYNDVDAPGRVVPETVSLAFEDGVVKLPPHSITICNVS